MSATTTSTSTTISEQHQHSMRPSFPGLVRGELLKISRQWSTWIMAILLFGIICLPYLLQWTVPGIKDALLHQSSHFFYSRIEANLAILRVFGGFFLIILTASVIGLEYQLGTIRIILARGVGRLQLLAAKLSAIVLVALVLLGAGLLLNAILISLLVSLVTGNLNVIQSLSASFWADMRVFVLSIMLSMGVTILMATAMSVIGRSLTIGLSAALIWFPADNIGTIFMTLAYRLTNNNFWLNITAYFLGPNINVLSKNLLMGDVNDVGPGPLVQVNSTHILLVILVYALIFLVTAVILTWRKDVKE